MGQKICYQPLCIGCEICFKSSCLFSVLHVSLCLYHKELVHETFLKEKLIIPRKLPGQMAFMVLFVLFFKSLGYYFLRFYINLTPFLFHIYKGKMVEVEKLLAKTSF
jgi:hypothetical protein